MGKMVFWNKSKVYLGIMALAVVAFSGGIYVAGVQSISGSPSDIRGLLWPDPPALTPFDLVDDEGAPFTIERLKGRWSFLFFGFTNCPDVCPTALATLNTVYETLQDSARFRKSGQVIFVSVDPQRDTTTALHAYVRHFNDAFIAATGPDEKLAAFTRQLGITYGKVKGENEAYYTVDHSAGILLIDPAVRLVGVFSMPHEAHDIAARYTTISKFIESQS